MKRLVNYCKIAGNFYDESSYKIKIAIQGAAFITAFLIKRTILNDVSGFLAFVMGLLSFSVLFSLYSYLFYRLKRINREK